MRLTARLLWGALAVALVVAVLLYTFTMRTGRYQITRLDTTLYAILDTATGETWVFRGRADHSGKEMRIEFLREDHTDGTAWHDRLRLNPVLNDGR